MDRGLPRASVQPRVDRPLGPLRRLSRLEGTEELCEAHIWPFLRHDGLLRPPVGRHLSQSLLVPRAGAAIPLLRAFGCYKCYFSQLLLFC